MPGTDSEPVVTVYQYAVSKPNNPDNDVKVRFVANNKVSEGYYLAEKTADVEAFVKANGKDAYAMRVVNANNKISWNEDKVADLTITDLAGSYTITAVGVNGGAVQSRSTVFVGLEWETVKTGTFYISEKLPNFVKAAGTTEIKNVQLQVCTTNDCLYRFPDLFAKGFPIKFSLLPSYTNSDAGGTYTFVRIPDQETGLEFGTYGGVNIRDVGYWQGKDSFITDSGYESGLYTDFSAFFMFQAYCSGGSLGYNAYHEFIPD